MAISKKLEIIYHNGQPDGIRSIRRHLSTMTTYVIPRSLLPEAKKLAGIDRPGIYYLISENDDNKITQLYIGQTRNGINRLEDHNRSKDFWNKAVLFLADSKTFSLDMISGLEAYAIKEASILKRFKIECSPNLQYDVDEYDLPAIEEAYEEIKFILATLGCKMEPSQVKQPAKQNEVGMPVAVKPIEARPLEAKPLDTKPTEDIILHITRHGTHARGIYREHQFEVLKGSEIYMDRKCCSGNIERQRQLYIQNGTICWSGSKFILSAPLTFSSPSTAATFVLGSSINGWIEWKDKSGRTLDELFRK